MPCGRFFIINLCIWESAVTDTSKSASKRSRMNIFLAAVQNIIGRRLKPSEGNAKRSFLSFFRRVRLGHKYERFRTMKNSTITRTALSLLLCAALSLGLLLGACAVYANNGAGMIGESDGDRDGDGAVEGPATTDGGLLGGAVSGAESMVGDVSEKVSDAVSGVESGIDSMMPGDASDSAGSSSGTDTTSRPGTDLSSTAPTTTVDNSAGGSTTGNSDGGSSALTWVIVALIAAAVVVILVVVFMPKGRRR